ncbi:MAG: M28 family peptidase [Vicingaceae bacterium]
MKIKFLSIALLIASVLAAQSFDSTAWKYAQSIQAKDLSKHLHVLASDEYEGRATGKKGQKMAMEYLIDQFKRFDIKDFDERAYKQSFDLIEQRNEGISITFNENTYELNRDFLFSPSIADKVNKEIEVVFVGYGIADSAFNSYENVEVKDKLVFFLNRDPKEVELKENWTLKKRLDYLKENGAIGALYEDSNVKILLEKYEHYFKKAKMKLAASQNNQFYTIRMDSKMTEELLSVGKLKNKKIKKKGIRQKDYFTTSLSLNIDKPTDKLTGENVLAYIPGTTKKDQLIVLTAHYDHLGKEDSVVYNGADDDGTGTSTLIELAEAFQQAVKEGNGPKRSILIMPVSGEEKGLLGSRHYTDNPVFPLENTVANLNIDMIGRYDEAHKEDSNYVYLIGADKLSQDLHDLSEKVNSTYMNFNLDYTFNAEDDPNRFYYRSDHYNFAKNNVPVIFYFSGVHEDYHKATDTVEKIDFEKTERIAKLVFLTAWHLANAEERIELNDEVEK